GRGGEAADGPRRRAGGAARARPCCGAGRRWRSSDGVQELERERGDALGVLDVDEVAEVLVDDEPAAGRQPGLDRLGRRAPAQGLRLQAQHPEEGCGEDRKSTRLNSSHVKISYAVFCLKKKNKPSSSLDGR